MTKREQDKHSKMLIERAALQLRREEEEKQRHKEMFAKKPTSSFQNVAKLGMTPSGSGDKPSQGSQQEQEAGDLPPRTKSALSLLLNPDPSIFPENHPYRRGYSSGELVRPGPSHMMGLTGMGGFGPLTSMNAGGGQQQRPQMHPVQLGGDPRMDQARPPQRRPAALDRQMSEQMLARDAAEAEQKKKQVVLDEQERVRKLVVQKEQLEEEERVRRARIQQVEKEERAQQEQLQQALQERAQRQQQQQRAPQRRVTDPPPPTAMAAQVPQEQQRHRRQASQASQQPKKSRPPSVHGGVGSMMPMAFRGAMMQANKSSAAMPVASQVDIGPIAALERPPKQGPAGTASTSNNAGEKAAGYRPRGPPQGQELDTDSEDETGDKENANAVNMAKSIAEEKLRMFAEKRGIVPAPLGHAAPPSPLRPHPGPSAQRPHPQALETTPPWARQPHQDQSDHRIHGGPRVTPQPIPLMHPYNLPVAAIPTTPRTTRKLMLRTELSESVRRGLLWERQQGVRPIKRTTSAGNAEGLGRFPPIPQLAASPSMVQLRPKMRRLEGQEEGAVTGAAPAKKATPEELEERKKRALARNRSDANNFHTSGW
jgi:Protein of unknown function (DUF3295)